MRSPARPRLPDGDCVFISGARIVARANAPRHCCRHGATGNRPSTHPCAYCLLGFETLEIFEFRNRERSDDGLGRPQYEYMERAQSDSVATPQGYSKSSSPVTFNNEPTKASVPVVKTTETKIEPRAERFARPSGKPRIVGQQKRQEEPVQPKITQEQIDAIEIDDAVFHRAFGYGGVLCISGDYIAIDFHEGKKKSSGKFMLSQAFYQGLLKLG